MVSPELFRYIVENSPEAFKVYDLSSRRFIYANSACVVLTGRAHAELLALSLEEHLEQLHPDDRPAMVELEQRVIAGSDQSARFIYRYQKKAPVSIVGAAIFCS